MSHLSLPVRLYQRHVDGRRLSQIADAVERLAARLTTRIEARDAVRRLDDAAAPQWAMLSEDGRLMTVFGSDPFTGSAYVDHALTIDADLYDTDREAHRAMARVCDALAAGDAEDALAAAGGAR